MIKSLNYKAYSNFIETLAKKLTKFYYRKLNKSFKVSNKLKGKGYDPVTSADKAFEKFIRKEIYKKFPNHQVIGEEFGHKKSKVWTQTSNTPFRGYTHVRKRQLLKHRVNQYKRLVLSLLVACSP